MMGYDVERFVIPVNDGLLCCICRDVLEDPLQGPCEHAYCSSCIRAWLVNNHTCPEDRQLLYPSELRPLFRYMKNDLDRLDVRCRNYNAGCMQIFQLSQIERHESTCVYITIKCPSLGCNQMVPKRSLEEHLRVCQFQTHCCPKGCGLAILSDEDRTHSCVAELHMTVELLRSEFICKVEESAKETEVRLEAQKRFMLRREHAFLGQVEGIQDQLTTLTEQLEIIDEKLNQQEKEIQEIKVEKRQILEEIQDYTSNRNCRQCSRQERIKMI